MISAYQEELITIDELRTRLPDLRAREASLRSQLEALDAQSADQQTYLKLAHDLDTFLAGLRTTAATSDVHERQRIVRLLVKDVLVGQRRSPSGTASRFASTPPAAGTTPQPPTRRVITCRFAIALGA